MFAVNAAFSWRFLYLSISFLSTMSNAEASKIKGMYYERRQANEESVKDSTISTHENLRYFEIND